MYIMYLNNLFKFQDDWSLFNNVQAYKLKKDGTKMGTHIITLLRDPNETYYVTTNIINSFQQNNFCQKWSIYSKVLLRNTVKKDIQII